MTRKEDNSLGKHLYNIHLQKNKIILLFVCCFVITSISAQHGFPEGHYCNSENGWKTKRCKALYGMKKEDFNKVIVIPHRGLWGAPGIPETSLIAIQEAYNKGYMFCEIDVIMTKDRKLILCHDQQPNRMTNAPATFSNNGGVDDPGNFFRSLNYNTTTNNSVPDANGSMYPIFPALKDLYYKDRQGNITNQKINTLEEALDFCKNKEIILALDIKVSKMSDPVIKNEYLEVMKLTLELAKTKGCLHQIIFKPGSAGQVTLPEIQNYLNQYNLWDTFSKLTNVVLIDIMGNAFPLATNKAYIDSWLSLSSLIGVEYIYKNPQDELIIPKSEFGNKSIVQYTKDKGFKTGVFHPTPTDETGSPGGRGSYYNPKNYGTLDDLRGSLEFLFGVPNNVFPGMLVTDRPDSDMDFLELFNLNSKYTKRSTVN